MSSISLSHKDYSNPIDENINESFILRHRLEKKYPEKEISELVEPIIYHLDKEHSVRPIIKRQYPDYE